MSLSVHPDLERRLRARADAAGESVDDYLDRLIRDDVANETDLDRLISEALESGEPIQDSPRYWEEKHRRLDERLISGR